MPPTEAKRIREAMGLTLTEMAAKMRVTEDAVRKWERGINPLSGPALVLYQIFQKELEGATAS